MPWRKTELRYQRGFTLLEVMVALVIIFMLAGAAYPSYQESIRKSKRMEGRAALMQLMQQQERFHTLHNSYIGFSSASTDEDERKFKWFSGNSAQRSAYEIKGQACAGETIQDCVLLIATPGTSKVDASYADPVCGELKLDSTGGKTANKTDCWM